MGSAFERPWLGPAVAVALWSAALPAGAQPFLVRDLAKGGMPVGSSPERFVGASERVYFDARTPAVGREMWRTDGTSEGTYLLRDVNPGPADAIVTFEPDDKIVDRGVLYFCAAQRDGYAPVLWKTDGSIDGTRVVSSAARCDGEFVAWRDHVYFCGWDAEHGDRLWRSDGTTAGTQPALEVVLWSGAPRNLAVVGGDLFFAAYDPLSGVELWRSDGTPAGTRQVADAAPGSANTFPEDLHAFGVRVIYTASVDGDPRRLWLSDGTGEGTQPLAPAAIAESPGDIRVVGELAYFAASDAQADRELWRTDGTEAGTLPLTDERADAIGPVVVFEGAIYFSVHSGHSWRIWKTDGTRAGTVPTSEWVIGAWPGSLVPFQDRLYFSAGDETLGHGLWSTDGTFQGTALLVGNLAIGGDITPVGTMLVFGADDGQHGAELWRSDGTAEGTMLLKQLSPEVGSAPADPIVLGGRIAFTAATPETGREIWTSDGTAAGTALLADVWPGSGGSFPETSQFPRPFGTHRGEIARVGNHLFFSAVSPDFGDELWISDGTPANTRLLLDVRPGRPRSMPRQLTPVGGRLAFVADDFDEGAGYSRELWITDGSTEGTRLVRDIRYLPAIPGQIGPQGVTAANGALFFSADDTLSGPEPWVSDGTEAGTRRLADIVEGYFGSYPDEFTTLSSSVLFVARFGELWRTDGTTEGTALIRSILVGEPDINDLRRQPGGLTVLGDAVLFAADDQVSGYELWSTDGTAEGTTLVRDINPGRASAMPIAFEAEFGGTNLVTFGGQLVRVGGEVFFPADDGSHGLELWASDGTAAGTRLIRDIAGGDLNSQPSALTAVGSRLVFNACDDAGCEPWVSDGSESGTRRLADLAPGALSSNPTAFVALDSGVLFSADDGVHGAELWAIESAPCVGDCNADGRVTVAEVVAGVMEMLSGTPSPACSRFRPHGGGPLTVADLIAAVSHILTGCPL